MFGWYRWLRTGLQHDADHQEARHTHAATDEAGLRHWQAGRK
jgi:hypothetical protein